MDLLVVVLSNITVTPTFNFNLGLCEGASAGFGEDGQTYICTLSCGRMGNAASVCGVWQDGAIAFCCISKDLLLPCSMLTQNSANVLEIPCGRCSPNGVSRGSGALGRACITEVCLYAIPSVSGSLFTASARVSSLG